MKTTLLAAAISGMIMGGASLAEAAATHHDSGSPGGAFDSGAQQLDDHAASKHSCKGKNACKSQGGCKTDKHACKGQNDCKGQGGCKG